MKNTSRHGPRQIAEWLGVLLEPGQVVELRALDVVEQYGKPSTHSGYFDTDHLPELANVAAELSESSKGVYWALNPLNPALLARRANREARAEAGETTSDGDILRRRWLLVDCDPKRPAGISATDEEKELARQVAVAVDAFLFDSDWPVPIMADSGNGFHLLYRIDLPADDGELVKRCLLALARQFDTDQVSIDTSVFNPARICKVYGTKSRKGDDIPARPHRQSKIINIPDELTPVPVELLERLSAEVRAETKPDNGNGHHDSIARAWLPSGDVRERARRYLAKIPPAVAGEHGHDSAFHAASVLVQGFALSPEEASPLLAEWNASCQPPWSERELSHKLDDAAKQPGPRGELLKTRNDNVPLERTTGHAEPAAGSITMPPFSLDLMTSEQFGATNYRQHFLIRRVLVEGQPGVAGGPKKTLKTSTLADLALSLGTGTPFLGHDEFTVPDAVNVLMLSGESGGYVLQETARRIALARGLLLSNARVLWGFKLPQLSNAVHLAELAKQIRDHDIKVAIVDPAYLCLLSAGMSSNLTSNVFAMGLLLKALSDIGQATGCTIIVCHHTRKGDRTALYGVPDLEDLSGSGFAEWARQWILVNRREAYVAGSGEHRLWLNVGGSAGHGATWALDISEGTIDEQGSGRTWNVSVMRAAEAVQLDRAERDQAQNRAKQETAERNADRIRALLLKAFEPLTVTKLKTNSGMNPGTFNTAFALLQDDLIEESVKGGNGRTCTGYRVVNREVGQVGQRSGTSGTVPLRRSGTGTLPFKGVSCPCPTSPELASHSSQTESVPLLADQSKAL